MLRLQGYYKQLMDKQLIVPGGMIVVDNALMKVLHSVLVSRRSLPSFLPVSQLMYSRFCPWPPACKVDAVPCPRQGRVYAPGDTKDESAEAIRKFNEFVSADERVETVTLPIRDGVSIVQRRCDSHLPCHCPH